MDAAQTSFIEEKQALKLSVDGEIFADVQSRCDHCIDLNTLRSEVGYWRAKHRKAKEREERLRLRIEELEAKLRLRERQLFARKSERGAKGKHDGGKPNRKDKTRKRGQQPGVCGHGRRLHENLPVENINCSLPQSERNCNHCGLPFEELGLTEDSQEVVVEVKAHRRVIKRKRYQPTC